MTRQICAYNGTKLNKPHEQRFHSKRCIIFQGQDKNEHQVHNKCETGTTFHSRAPVFTSVMWLVLNNACVSGLSIIDCLWVSLMFIHQLNIQLSLYYVLVESRMLSSFVMMTKCAELKSS